MNQRDNSDKPPVLSDARHSASLLEDSALLKSVTPPPAPPVPLRRAAVDPAKLANPSGESFGSAAMTLVRDVQFHPPLIVLAVVVGSIAFLSGFWIHELAYRVVSPPKSTSEITGIAISDGDAAPNATTLTGRLAWYDVADQKVKDDSDAVIILLPEDNAPSMLLSTRGARSKSQQEELATQIYELGGGFATTNSDGVFTVAVEPGNYILIALSGQPRSTTEPIPTSVTTSLKRYFVSPDDGLVGTSRYHYVRSFTVPASPILHVF